MSHTKKLERAPGFQFFPEKHLAHTRRLSDTAYRVYFDLLCALWMQAPDHCSVAATPQAVSVLIAADVERVRPASSGKALRSPR